MMAGIPILLSNMTPAPLLPFKSCPTQPLPPPPPEVEGSGELEEEEPDALSNLRALRRASSSDLDKSLDMVVDCGSDDTTELLLNVLQNQISNQKARSEKNW